MAMQAFMSRLAAVIATLAVVLASMSLAIAMTASNHFRSVAANSSPADLQTPNQSDFGARDFGPAAFSLVLAVTALLFALVPEHSLPKWARPGGTVEPSRRLFWMAVLVTLPVLMAFHSATTSVGLLLTAHDRPVIEQPAFGSLGRSFGTSAVPLSLLANMITWTRFKPKSMIESPADS